MKKVLFIGGATGIGKSALAVRLAERYNGVIVGADSMQIYKGMDIGTGKIKEKEKHGILHTMIDIVAPNTEYSLQQYAIDAKKAIHDALQNDKLPIVVGGTGFYIHSLINEQNFANAPPNPELREQLQSIAEAEGSAVLYDRLKAIDKDAAARIYPQDTRRIIRALEIHAQTGEVKSHIATSTPADYDYKFYVLQMPRDKLYARIDARVEQMFVDGLSEEIYALSPHKSCKSMQAIGYKECFAAIAEGKVPRDALPTIQQSSRRYAKRQIAFFKWIPAQKTYVGEDFYTNIIADPWFDALH